VAAELAQPSYPEAARTELLDGEKPLTVTDVRQKKAEVKSATMAEMQPAAPAAPAPSLPPDYADVAARFLALGTRLEATGNGRYTLWPAGHAVGIGNEQWSNVLDRLAAQERRASDPPTSRPLGPGQPTPPPWPDPPAGWRWNRRGAPAHLIASDGWTTRNYNDPARALAEAEEYRMRRPVEQEPTVAAIDAALRSGDLNVAAELAPASIRIPRRPTPWLATTRGIVGATADELKRRAVQLGELSDEERAELLADIRRLARHALEYFKAGS